MVMLYKSCRVIHRETKKIGFAFSCFSTIFYEFYKVQQKSKHYWRSTFKQVPRKNLAFTTMSLPLTKMPPRPKPLTSTPLAAMTGSPTARDGRTRATNDVGTWLSSPLVDWWQWLCRGGRRRRCAAAPGGGGHYGLNTSEERGNADKHATAWALVGSRGCARVIERPCLGSGGWAPRMAPMAGRRGSVRQRPGVHTRGQSLQHLLVVRGRAGLRCMQRREGRRGARLSWERALLNWRAAQRGSDAGARNGRHAVRARAPRARAARDLGRRSLRARADVGDPDAEEAWVPRGSARGRGGTVHRCIEMHRFKLICTGLTGRSSKVLN
jgi:hypothetical protein